MKKLERLFVIMLVILAYSTFAQRTYAIVPQDDEEDSEDSLISPSNGNHEDQQETSTENQGEDSQLRIEVNERYQAQNSKTTDLGEMNQEQLRHVNQLTYEEANKNMVMFKGELDLSSENAMQKMNKFHEYADLSQKGKVMIDTDYLDMLEVPATVTMYNLSFKTTPLIYKDGVRATANEVSNVVYIYSNSEQVGTLTFDVTSFSTYEAKGDETVGEVYEKVPTTNPMFRMLLLIGLITLIGIVVAIGVKIIEKKREKDASKEPVSKAEGTENSSE